MDEKSPGCRTAADRPVRAGTGRPSLKTPWQRMVALLASSCVWLLACTTMAPVYLQLKYAPVEGPVAASAPDDGPATTLRIAGVDVFDRRVDQASLGATDTPVYGTGLVDWVGDGIASLAASGYTFTRPDEQTDPSGLALRVNIKRTSCRGTVMNMRCTVVIDVAYLLNGQSVKENSYYGTDVQHKGLISQGTRHFGEEVVQKSLNAALEQCLIQLDGDLRKLDDVAEVSAVGK